MNKLAAMLMGALLMLSIATGTISSSVGIGICAATDTNQYGGGAEYAPKIAPLNPDFVAYCKNRPDTSFGYIPPPVDYRHHTRFPMYSTGGISVR